MLIKIRALINFRHLNAHNGLLQIKRCASYKIEQVSKDILQNQSQILEVASGVRISPLCKNGKVHAGDDTQTMLDCFKIGLSLSGKEDCLGWKPGPDEPYKWMTYNDVWSRSKSFGDGLLHLGVIPSNDTLIGVQSDNRPEYFINDLGNMRHSLCTVPIYNNIEIDNLKFIMEHAGIRTMVVDNDEKVNDLLKWRKDLPLLERIIMFEKVKTEKRRAAESLGVKLYHFEEVEEFGLKHPATDNPPKSEDLHLVCYTSGTTGTPKGVKISHRNLCSAVNGLLKHMQGYGITDESTKDTMLSYLPLAHIYERLLQGTIILYGSKLGYYQGDPKKITVDCEALKPTILPAVPRLLNRIHDKILMEAYSNPLKKFIFKLAMARKRKYIEKGIVRNDTIWDRLIFKKIQVKLGGSLKCLSSGAAPLSPTVHTNLQCILGCPIFEGYGSTETSAGGAVSIPGAEVGNVGSPNPCVMVKLVDVPEMNYLTSNNQGEIYIKGPSVFKGYLNNDKKTKEALTKDNWYITGDIGEWTPTGALKIIDRRKHLFKLAQGEFIAPEKIENVLLLSPYILQAFVYGDGLRTFLVAVLVVDPDTFSRLAKDIGLTAGPLEETCRNVEIQTKLLEELKELSRLNGLSPLEQVKRVFLTTDELSLENGMMTPTFKLKRPIIKTRYRTEIEEMYNKGKP